MFNIKWGQHDNSGARMSLEKFIHALIARYPCNLTDVKYVWFFDGFLKGASNNGSPFCAFFLKPFGSGGFRSKEKLRLINGCGWHLGLSSASTNMFLLTAYNSVGKEIYDDLGSHQIVMFGFEQNSAKFQVLRLPARSQVTLHSLIWLIMTCPPRCGHSHGQNTFSHQNKNDQRKPYGGKYMRFRCSWLSGPRFKKQKTCRVCYSMACRQVHN